jgi:oxalate decarboxylase/phosphoglucose isomerase-like protein (cupin superfamily)
MTGTRRPTWTSFAFGKRAIRKLPVKCGSVIYTKSGGIHGIRNHGNVPLRFVAFGYHSALEGV